MWLDLSPPHPYLPWPWLTLVLPAKNQKFLLWGFGAHVLKSWGSSSPTVAVCHSLSFIIPRQTNGMVVRPSCHGPVPGGNWRWGRAALPRATPSQIFGPQQMSLGKKKTLILHSIKKKPISLCPRSTKHSALQALPEYPTRGPASPAAEGLKSGKEATSAGQDMERVGKESFINKLIAILRVRGGGQRGRGWCPERGAAVCTVAEKIENSFDFFF